MCSIGQRRAHSRSTSLR